MKKEIDDKNRLRITFTKSEIKRFRDLLKVYISMIGNENQDVNILYDYFNEYLKIDDAVEKC